MWNIGNLQKPRWQILTSGGSCKGHSRIVFSLSAGGEHCITLVSVSMDRQVSHFGFVLHLLHFNFSYLMKCYLCFIIIFTAYYIAYDYLHQGVYIMPGLCLSVCLLATICKSYCMDLHENFTTDVSVDKEELIKFWKSSASRSGFRNFLKNSSALQYRAFLHSLVYISRELSLIHI